MKDSVDVEMVEAGVVYRDRSLNPDPRRADRKWAVEIDSFQASVILGEGDTPAEAFERAKEVWLAHPEARKPSYEELETSLETWRHIDLLRKLLRIMSVALLERGETHDRSKFDRTEVDTFTEFTPKLKSTTYGSDEYKAFLVAMKPALDHHYAHNRHHPEHFVRGVQGMHLVDLLEMTCDWYASTKRHSDGDIHRSIDLNQKRFGLSDELTTILHNTADLLQRADGTTT